MSDTPRTAMAAIREWRGGLKVLVWIGGVGAPVVFALCAFTYRATVENARTNSVQDTKLDDLKARAIEDREEQRRQADRTERKIDAMMNRLGVPVPAAP